MLSHRFHLLSILALFGLLLSLQPATTRAQTYAFTVYTAAGNTGGWCYSDTPMSANIYVTCNDQISSVVLRAGWSVRLYRDQNQTGPSFCLSRSDGDLSDNTFEDGSAANDAISSFALVNQAWCGGTATPAYQLEVYNDPGFGGSWCYSWFAQAAEIYASCADQVSSVLLRAGWSVRLYRDAGRVGPSQCLSASDDNLADNTFDNGSPMDNAISSFVLFSAANCGAIPNQAPNPPTPTEPGNGGVTTSRTLTLRVQDTGDPDNRPRTYRDFQFVIERADGSWSQTSPWTGNSWTVTVPTHANYRWRAQSGDGELASGWSGWSNVVSSVGNVVQPQPIPPGPGWNVPYYSQGDPRWGGARIGACNNTIANVGCALTSLAMVFTFYGANHTPGTLNSCMGNHACLLYWGSPTISRCSNGKVRWGGSKGFSYSALEQEVKQRPVILEISKPCGSGRCLHFIVVLSGSGTNPRNYIVNDPGVRNGARTTLASSLAIFKGYTPSGMRIYTGTPARLADVDGAQVAEAPPALAAPQLAAGEVITGSLEIYRNTETEVFLELAATSSAGAVTEMRVMTDQQPSDAWQPVGQYVSVPMGEVFSVQFRDAAGNTSSVITTAAPSAPDSIVQPSVEVYLPLLMR